MRCFIKARLRSLIHIYICLLYLLLIQSETRQTLTGDHQVVLASLGVMVVMACDSHGEFRNARKLNGAMIQARSSAPPGSST